MTSPDNKHGNGWTNVRLRFVAEVNPLAPPRSILTDDTLVSFLPMEAIGEDGSLRLETDRPVAELRAGYSYFADGDVAFAKVTPCFENGKGALMRGLTRGIGFGTTEVTVLRPGLNLHAGFLNYFVNSLVFRQPGAGAMQGAGGLKRVPDEFTRNSVLPLPPVQVQRSVVSFLDRETPRIDGLIQKKTRFIELLREKRQALITQAVTRGLDPNAPLKDSGVEWLGLVPASWTVMALARVTVSRCDGPFGSAIKSEHYADDGVRVIRLQNISLEGFRGDDSAFLDATYCEAVVGHSHDVEPGDLLMAGLGDQNNPLGRTCVAPPNIGRAIVKADCYRFRLDSRVANPAFMAYQLSANARAECGYMSTGSTRERLNLGLAASRRVALPPTLAEQASVVRAMSMLTKGVDRQLQLTRRSIELLHERRAALITAAVTGQIDVREAA